MIWTLLACASSPTDRDGDGTPDQTDCAPSDRTVHPGAPEICDGMDQDCDGVVDAGCLAATLSVDVQYQYADNIQTDEWAALLGPADPTCVGCEYRWAGEWVPTTVASRSPATPLSFGFGDEGARAWVELEPLYSGDESRWRMATVSHMGTEVSVRWGTWAYTEYGTNYDAYWTAVIGNP